jgi:hypothetical protein
LSSHYYEGPRYGRRKEKLTDVNIAVELLLDAADPDGYNHAILLTGDYDLSPAVRAIHERLAAPKAVSVWRPPGQESSRWKKFCRARGIECRRLTEGMLADSRLPDRIVASDGGVIECLPEWQMP